MTFEVLDHTADVGIRAEGSTLEEAFSECARGMFSLMGDIESCRPEISVEIDVEGHDLESLLYAFLSELLYLSETEEVLFSRFDIAMEGTRIRGSASGCRIADVERHMEIKAVTYHMLSVEVGETVRCQVLFDI